jgi:hypothetical protein
MEERSSNMDSSIILKWVLKKWGGRCGPDYSNLGPAAGFCEHDDKVSGIMKRAEIS